MRLTKDVATPTKQTLIIMVKYDKNNVWDVKPIVFNKKKQILSCRKKNVYVQKKQHFWSACLVFLFVCFIFLYRARETIMLLRIPSTDAILPLRLWYTSARIPRTV